MLLQDGQHIFVESWWVESWWLALNSLRGSNGGSAEQCQ
jgi:hypothetical protein